MKGDQEHWVWRGEGMTYLVQPIQHLDGRLPIDTRIGDTDTILKSRRA